MNLAKMGSSRTYPKNFRDVSKLYTSILLMLQKSGHDRKDELTKSFKSLRFQLPMSNGGSGGSAFLKHLLNLIVVRNVFQDLVIQLLHFKDRLFPVNFRNSKDLNVVRLIHVDSITHIGGIKQCECSNFQWFQRKQ